MRWFTYPSVLVLVLLGALPARAGDCGVNGPPPALDSKAIDWTLAIASGQSCVRGLRTRAMTLESVSISSPAKVGVATVQGYSFSYRAPRDYRGEDSFAVTMVGTNRQIGGSTVVRVHVSIR